MHSWCVHGFLPKACPCTSVFMLVLMCAACAHVCVAHVSVPGCVLYEVCACVDIHCVLGIKVFAFMCVRVSVHYGQFTCDVCSHVVCVHMWCVCTCDVCSHVMCVHMCVHMCVLVCVFVCMCVFLICMSVYSCDILGGRQGDSNYICVFMCVHVYRRITD